VEDDHLAARALEDVELDAVGAVGARARKRLGAVLGRAGARPPMADDERPLPSRPLAPPRQPQARSRRPQAPSTVPRCHDEKRTTAPTAN
jgi:hypothetical protein